MTSPTTSIWSWSWGAVAHADRSRVFEAVEPVELSLGGSSFPADAVHDLELAGVTGDGADEPVAPSGRFVGASSFEQRQQREGCVS